MGSWRSRHDPLPAWAATLLVVSLGAPLRAQSEGDLDASYGDPAAPGRQVRYFDLGPTGYDLVTGAATDGAGRALAVGLVETVDVTFPYALGLARFDRKGQVDEAFGNEPARPGTVTLDLPSSQEIPGRSIEVLSDGRIVVAGSRLLASVLSSVGFFSRIAADGSAVETTVSFNLPATPTALPPRVRGFARDGDGRYLAFGDVLAFGQPMVARLTSAFAIDAAYGSGGWIGIDPFEPGESGSASVRQLRIDSQGRAIGVLSGTISGGDDFSALFRLLPSGALDPDFGSGGLARILPDFLASCGGAVPCHPTLLDLALAPDGTLYAAGRVDDASAIPTVRYGWLVQVSADGDALLQAAVLPSAAGASLELTALALDPRGGILVAGATTAPSATDGSCFAARYESSALSIDPNFALAGRQEFDFVGIPGYTLSRAAASALAFDGGRPLLAGAALFGSSGDNLDFAVARLWSAWIFVDGFESGGVARWNAASGAP